MTVAKLRNPPIVEVVCGIIFEPITGLDPLTAGAYWSRCRTRYPTHELRPAVIDAAFTFGPVPKLRALLFHSDRTMVLQFQDDRLYVNWRRPNADTIEGAREGEYPRFSDRPGRPGLVTRVLDEYRSFAEFATETFGVVPRPTRIELAKVDLLIEGEDWRDFTDLADALPWLQSFRSFARSLRPGFALQFNETRQDGDLVVTISQTVASEPAMRRVVKLESRILKPFAAGELRDAFTSANTELNEVFGDLIPQEQRRQRFSEEGT